MLYFADNVKIWAGLAPLDLCLLDKWQSWGFAFCVNCHVLFFAKPDFLVPAFAVFFYSVKRRYKNGGVNDLGKLWSATEQFCPFSFSSRA